jgi:hypothetical protein
MSVQYQLLKTGIHLTAPWAISPACRKFTFITEAARGYMPRRSISSCEKHGVSYQLTVGQGMYHFYPMLPWFPEGKCAYRILGRFLYLHGKLHRLP